MDGFSRNIELIAKIADEQRVGLKFQRKSSTAAHGLDYSSFDQLDGSHPWQDAVPEGYVLYPVRELRKGIVAYFNFSLAKEMGLLSSSHPNELNASLKAKILETFSIQIINEYDQINQVRFKKGLIKRRHYMATRYLQLQHKSRTGKTSGDGRSIWNGFLQNRGKFWDVSSRGTGVTRLSPGVANTGQFMKSGQSEIGYGCGMADLDELFGAAVMSEIFHRQGIETERVLAIIDLGDGLGIGVRAAPNLLRPAHLFTFLKQSKLESLKRAVHYLIDREHENGRWVFTSRHPRALELMLKKMVQGFAHFAARLDADYIFAWLDWDGDNVLASAGIIDYGSIRQFGVRHDEYRYDDVDRLSTNLREQKNKARYLVQVFCQVVDYLTTGEKKSLAHFRKWDELRQFDLAFETELLRLLLYRCGFEDDTIKTLLRSHRHQVKRFVGHFRKLESIKTLRKAETLPDGFNRPALLCMRTLLREAPRTRGITKHTDPDIAVWEKQELNGLLLKMRTSHFRSRDERLLEGSEKKLTDFLRSYSHLIQIAARATKRSRESLSRSLVARSSIINRSDRITGNSVALFVEELLQRHDRGLSYAQMQHIIEQVIHSQTLVPSACPPQAEDLVTSINQNNRPHLKAILRIIEDYKDDV